MKVTVTQIRAIAVNVFREALRDRILLIMCGTGIGVMAFSIVLGELAVGARTRVIQNTGFWVIGLWGLLTVLYLGSNVIRREIHLQTIYLVLSRPVSRNTFMAGKYAGMLLVLTVVFAVLAAAFAVLLHAFGIDLTPAYGWTLLFLLGEWILLAGFSLLFEIGRAHV